MISSRMFLQIVFGARKFFNIEFGIILEMSWIESSTKSSHSLLSGISIIFILSCLYNGNGVIKFRESMDQGICAMGLKCNTWEIENNIFSFASFLVYYGKYGLCISKTLISRSMHCYDHITFILIPILGYLCNRDSWPARMEGSWSC